MLFLSFAGLAQQPQSIESQGNIPQEILLPVSKKYEVETKNKAFKNLKIESTFTYNSHYYIDRLLKSGLTVYNDPISTYANSILQEILRVNPQLKRNAKVYLLRRPDVNAFATDHGIIFITMGLLAHLENEAQLAYILCHELVHVEKRHALDLFIESKAIDKKKSVRNNNYKDFNLDEKLIRKNQYSQNLEKEADAEGLNYFLKTGYTTTNLDQVFDVLHYSYLPFDLIPLDSTFFNDNYFHLPASIWERPLNPIAASDEEVDSTSTHPGSEERRKLLIQSLEKKGVNNGSAYLVSESEFITVRNMARQELPELYLHSGNLPDAAYHAYLLQKTGQQGLRSEKALLKALYLYAKLKNEELFSDEIPKVSKIQGASQRMHLLLDTLDAKVLTILSLKYGWKLRAKYKEDQEVNNLVKDLFTELGRHVNTLDEFRVITAKAAEEIPQPIPPQEEEKKKTKKSKLSKIKEEVRQQTPVASESAQAYWRGAFVLEKTDTSFSRQFQEGLSEWNKRKEWKAYAKSYEGIVELSAKARRRESRGYYMGVKKFVVVNPTYIRINANGMVEEALLKTELGQKSLHDLVKEVGKMVKAETKILDVNQLKAEQTEEFNELRYLNDWFNEQIQYSNLSITPGVHQPKIDAIAKKYGTDYFIWTGVLCMKHRGSVGGNIALSLVTLPIAPFVFHKASMRQYSTYVFAMVCNVKTGQMTLIKDQAFYGKDSESMLKKHYYDILNQVVSKPKK